MKTGSSIAFVRDFDTSPLESRNTRMIASACASGAEFASEKSYSDTIEDVAGTPKRTVTWLMNGSKTMRFSPIPKEEEVTFLEFQQRFNSQEWCEANPNHPISYMRAAFDANTKLVDVTKNIRPMLLIRKGKHIATVPSGNDPESKAQREKILSFF